MKSVLGEIVKKVKNNQSHSHIFLFYDSSLHLYINQFKAWIV